MSRLSVPFKIKDILFGVAVCNGVLCLDDGSVSIESQTKCTLIGLLKTRIKYIRIAVDDIQEVDFKKSMFGNSITIRLSKLSIANQLPKQEPGEIKLSIHKNHVEAAEELVHSLKMEISDFKLKTVSK